MAVAVLKEMARRIPPSLRKVIIEEQFIDKAINTDVTGTPMEYLFDVYEEFIDTAGEFENWTCYKCRDAILNNWRKIKPFLIDLENGNEI